MENKLNINNMPVLKALMEYEDISPVRLHMPGHKACKAVGKFFGNICKMDITELSFSDNLLKSESIIKKSEDLCAESYGAEAVKYCTCGTTVTLLSLLYSVKNLGGSLIIERNSHKSVYSALKISGIEPVIIDNAFDNETGLYKHVTAENVKAAIEKNPSVIGALITSPDYYGFCAELEGISKALKDNSKLLFVDAAHGGHIPFYRDNIYRFADVYVCSAHKTLFSFTQGAFAVFNNFKLYDNYLKSFNIFHTTSPSYLILASLDFSREYMRCYGRQRLESLKADIQKYKRLIYEAGFACADNDDFTRLVINVSKKGLTGYKAAEYLENKGIFCEFADGSHIVALLSAADGAKGLKKLYYGLKRCKGGDGELDRAAAPEYAERAMPYIKAASSAAESIPLSLSAGRVSACEAGLYPPGCPLLCCGDTVTEEIRDFLLANASRTFGIENDSILVVK